MSVWPGKWQDSNFKIQLMHVCLNRANIPLNTLVAHRAWSSVPAKIDPVRLIRPIMANVVLSKFGGKTRLYSMIFVQRLLRGSSKKGKENSYPVLKITASMLTSVVPSSKMTEDSVKSLMLVFIVTFPQRMQLGSSSFTINFDSFLWTRRNIFTIATYRGP